jgi:hypothetical protein
MRSYGMYDASRGLTLAFAAALVGLALWGASQIGTQSTNRFWLTMLIVAGAGLVLSLAGHVGTWTKGLRLRISPSTFFTFLLGLVVIGWILIASQPGSGWEEGRITSWSNSMGIDGAVHSIGLWRGVLAFGFGLLLGMAFDSVPAREVEEETAAPGYAGPPAGTTAPAAADEPVAAERRWTGRRGYEVPPAATPEQETTRTRGPVRTR